MKNERFFSRDNYAFGPKQGERPRNFTCQKLASVFFIALIAAAAFGQNAIKSFPAGCYIIDMGQPTQTIANGLKPYGLVYQLIIGKDVPVNWAINSSKIKDGEDFVAEGKSYRGGSFIIEGSHVTPDVLSAISLWKAKGVVVDGPTSTPFSAPVYKVLTSWPRAVLDAQNDQLITPYYANAEVPVESYVTAGNPTLLTNCGDVYVLPHADPQDWTTASGYAAALQNFIKNDGYLWIGCHALSALESLPGCNFLSDTGCVLWTSHSNGTPPYTYKPSTSGDPIMQFLGTLDASTQNGSEQIFLPLAPGWRSTTTIAVYDPDHPQVPGLSPGPAAVVAYGRAFGTSGIVMFEAGHSLSGGTVASNVAAQRAFFNFLLFAGVQKQLLISDAVFPGALAPGATYNLSATVSAGVGPYTYLWTSSCGGTFSNPASSKTSFTACSTVALCKLQLKITDACGRANFASEFPIPLLNNEPLGKPVIATALDTNHDGFLDRIDISWTGTDTIRTTLPSVSEWVYSLKLVTRDSQVVTLRPVSLIYDSYGNTIHIILNENTGPILETGINIASSFFYLNYVIMTTSGFPFQIGAIVDSAAPVIKAVCFTPGTNSDTLRVAFSEPVTASNKPGDPAKDYFSFVNNQNSTTHASNEFLQTIVKNSDSYLYVYQGGKILSNTLLVKEGTRPGFALSKCGNAIVPRDARSFLKSFLNVRSIGNGNRYVIEFSMPDAASSNLSILDLHGRIMKTILSEQLSAGRHVVQWNGTNEKGGFLTQGNYIVRLKTGREMRYRYVNLCRP